MVAKSEATTRRRAQRAAKRYRVKKLAENAQAHQRLVTRKKLDKRISGEAQQATREKLVTLQQEVGSLKMKRPDCREFKASPNGYPRAQREFNAQVNRLVGEVRLTVDLLHRIGFPPATLSRVVIRRRKPRRRRMGLLREVVNPSYAARVELDKSLNDLLVSTSGLTASTHAWKLDSEVRLPIKDQLSYCESTSVSESCTRCGATRSQIKNGPHRWEPMFGEPVIAPSVDDGFIDGVRQRIGERCTACGRNRRLDGHY